MLYLPYFVLFFRSVLKKYQLSLTAAMATVTLGALPMLVRAYGIIFQGRSLLW